MSARQFVHLRLHSEYSLVDSTLRIEKFVWEDKETKRKQVLVPGMFDRLGELAMPAVALTDELNLFAMVKFASAAEKAGIKPLIGADLWVQDLPAEPPTRLTLLCKNRDGYLNLSRLLTRAYVDGS